MRTTSRLLAGISLICTAIPAPILAAKAPTQTPAPTTTSAPKNRNFPRPLPDERLGAYRERVKRLGFAVWGTTKTTSDECTKSEETLIFGTHDFSQVLPVALYMFHFNSDQVPGYLAAIQKVVRYTPRQAKIFRDPKGRVIRISETKLLEENSTGELSLELKWTDKNAIESATINIPGYDGATTVEIKATAPGTLQFSLDFEDC